MADTKLFVDISHYIKTKPKEFRNAGKWLDECCSEKGYRDRIKEKIKEIEGKKQNIAGHVYERGKKSLEAKLENGQMSSLLFRFGEVCKEFFEKYKDEVFISIDVARRILLIAWILSDPDTEIVNLKITELEKWPWEPVDDVTKMSRGFSSYLFRQNTLNIAIVQKAWEKVSGGDSDKAIKWHINLIQLFKARSLWEKVAATLIAAFILWVIGYLWLGPKKRPESPVNPNSVTNQMGPNSTSQMAIGKDINQVLNIDNSHKEDKHIEFNFASGSEPNITFYVINYVDGLPQAENSELRELFEKGRDDYNKRNYNEAVHKFTRCLELSDNSRQRGALNHLIGNCYFGQYLYLKAVEYYAIGLRKSLEANDLAGVASNVFGRANTYMLRPASSIKMRGDNVRKAIEDYNNALKVFSKDEYPASYALTQNNLGNAYRFLPTATSRGRTENINASIICYQEALSIYTKEEYPVEYAMAKNNLGLAYIDLPAATSKERAKNVQSAIECYQESLKIREKDDYPVEYADTQTNLGSAYVLLPTVAYEEQVENINKSIKCYQEAMETRKKEVYPIGYALTQNNLGNVYSSLPWSNTEERINNINKAVTCFQEALGIFKKDKYPVYYALTKTNLGLAYVDLAVEIHKDRSQNIQIAIECYREALEIRKKDEYPQDYCGTSANLGRALSLINDPNACYWLKEAYSLKEYLNDQGKDIGEIIQQICK